MILLSALLSLAHAGCGALGRMATDGAVLATVGDQPVTEGMLDTSMSMMPPRAREQVDRAQAIETIALTEMLYQDACKRGIHKKKAVKQQVAWTEKQALAAAMIDTVVTERKTEAYLRAWYDAHVADFKVEQVRARHILVADEARANELLAQVRGGADFAEVARASSVDEGSAVNGGELGWFDQSRMVAPFADAAFAGKPGKIVGPVQTRFGWHIISIDDRRAAIPFEDARPEIEQIAEQEIAEAYLAELKDKYPVVKK